MAATYYLPQAGGLIHDFSAYISRKNLEQVEKIGGAPYIPFKTNAVANKNGETWRRLFHEFNLNRDEFCRHYHLRSNVESTFSMVKAKFRDHVRSKTDVAMTNEVLAKILCHNVVVCIHEMFTLGLAVEFGGDAVEPNVDADEPRIIKFPGA
ncbi:transposase [Limnoglobus roseus]|uniref:transposase n=1 Tax=Limnoglobus roseus TaxID=2598579 RepID=UPI00143CD2C4|nr:transposase [Limnoglobus roseus]